MTKHKMGMWLCSNCNISVLSGDAHFCNYNMGERKMKQFDPTKPYCRRDGVPAKIIYTLNSSRYPIVVVSQYSDGRGLRNLSRQGFKCSEQYC